MQKKNLFIVLVLSILINQFWWLIQKDESKLWATPPRHFTNQATTLTQLLVHYMPWYQAKPVRNYWGWHWTMNHFNPDLQDQTGKREIASHYYPLTGPYDSNDFDVLEYQVLLMKLSGIDGIIPDWYGVEDFWDYGLIHESTQYLFQYAQRAGLSFAVCYEDKTIKEMVNNNHLSADNAVTHAQEVMQFLAENWFSDPTYLKLDTRPVFLIFGPQYFYRSAEWEAIFSVLETPLHFFTLDNVLNPVATGAYPWPPMWKAVDGVLSEAALNEYLEAFYQKSANWEFLVAGAFPGFNDIYAEAGLGFSYGLLAANNGETFRSTMQKAIDNQADIVQIITWNDYGEGTTIEPTLEYGYQYLEMIQDFKKNSIDPDFQYQATDLRVPMKIYDLRKKHKGNSEINARLDTAFNLIVADELDSAIALIDEITSIALNQANENLPTEFLLEQNYPNPFNSSTLISYQLPRAGRVKLAIFNVAGQLVEILVDGMRPAGYHSVCWQAKDLSAGVYFCRIEAGAYYAMKKLLYLK